MAEMNQESYMSTYVIHSRNTFMPSSIVYLYNMSLVHDRCCMLCYSKLTHGDS